ncbi:ras-related protein RABA6b-like [Andrographis paniculata]|uniref:ras-related protein RABA6b-like n=1 Tax=Andrographis paniculata TaxID=175694 RepID=UPI0021E7CD27|nr:ras-related protein RABA6b-like [Andrographis paniculata]
MMANNKRKNENNSNSSSSGYSLDEECDYLFKAVLIGDSAVGKSNLLSRFARGEFCVDSKPTIGVEFAYRNIKVRDKLVKVQIWDTAGQERFRAITSSYYRGALGALLVYDITRRSSFESLRKWLKELREFGGRDMVVVLLGNKSDLGGHSREVNLEDGRSLAQLESLSFLETSAKDNLNVEEAFLQMITRIYELTCNKALLEPKLGGDHCDCYCEAAAAAPNTRGAQMKMKMKKKEEIICFEEDDQRQVSATKPPGPYCCPSS